MSSIQYQRLTDDEFERMVYATLKAGELPAEVVKELSERKDNDRELQMSRDALNPLQLTLPFNT